MIKANGAVLWEGRSLIDGQPLVIIVTGLEVSSQNIKTGRMLQTYVLRSDILPTESVKAGDDVSICGDCPLRKGICYVNLITVNSVWRKYKRGGYPNLDARMLCRMKRRGQILRITAYGDASSTPFEAWEPLIKACRSSTGYTHQWKNCDPRWQRYLMASVETTKLRHQASSLGWRTFRPMLLGDKPQSGEVVCTNFKDESLQCEDCLLCNGTSGKSSVDVCDPIHGISFKKTNFQKLLIQSD